MGRTNKTAKDVPKMSPTMRISLTNDALVSFDIFDSKTLFDNQTARLIVCTEFKVVISSFIGCIQTKKIASESQ